MSWNQGAIVTLAAQHALEAIAAVDSEILPARWAEVRRQEETRELIAWENHVFRTVSEAFGYVDLLCGQFPLVAL